MNVRSRQDKIVRLLRRSGSTTIAYLSESLNVSRRTLLRDLTSLRDHGFIIHSSTGPGGGIRLEPTSVLISPKLTSSEAFALLISISVLKETQSLPFIHLADAGLKKIEQSLKRDQIIELQKVLGSVYIGQSRANIPLPDFQKIDVTVLAAFEKCFLHHQRMKFQYIDRQGVETKRSADPHAILILSPAWYMVGYDPSKADFRHFRMDRMQGAEALNDKFQRRSFTLEKSAVCPFRSMSFV